jgi:hypothetical protein
MDELAAARSAIAPARAAREVALRELHAAEAHADFWREPDGSFPLINPNIPGNEAAFQEVQGLQPALDAATTALAGATAAHDHAMQAYDALAAQSSLFAADNSDPVLLLPVRIEAVYADRDGSPELWIRVYPDDVHVDSHEPGLTERERDAGVRYWREVYAAGPDASRRQGAWRALISAAGGARATWVRAALTPTGAPPGEPVFPHVVIRPEAWTRAAHTLLLPDRLEFSAYRAGTLVWRHPGAPIPDTLPVGLAPPSAGESTEPNGPPFDDQSRWLVDFGLAVECGMGLAVPLADPTERFDLLTVVGVGTQDAATGAARVQTMLASHSFSGGLAALPVGTPTNNTPGSRSGWRSRGAPEDPDVVAARRAAYDASGDQEAARLARALGIDGQPVLAEVCDPDSGDEPLLDRLQRLQADFMAWSRVWRPAADATVSLRPCTEPWYTAVADHYTRFVRGRGPLPPLRIGRQPYGILPVSSTELWRGEDVDPRISLHVRSFQSAFAEHVDRARHVGEEADQDAVLLDLLSREASPRRIASIIDFHIELMEERPPRAVVGSIPATSSFAWLHADPGSGDPAELEPFPAVVPEGVQHVIAPHPLTQLLVLFDEVFAQMGATQAPPDPVAFDGQYLPLARSLWQMTSPPTISLFYSQAEWAYNSLRNSVPTGPALPDEVARIVQQVGPLRNLFARYVALEDDAIADLPAFERLFRESLEPLSSRVDAWVTSMASARLSALRAQRPAGVRTGAYGWLTDVEPTNPNPSREGFVMTPSLHHATTAAVLRSGWQAHTDRRAFAVDIQSTRVRRAQAMIEGVRAGQTVAALLGYQFERALHDAHLNRFVHGFRQAYPLAPLLEPEGEGHEEAKTAIGARNVVDGQALRRARAELQDTARLQAAAVEPLGDDGPTLLRLLSELDETFDAVGDLLLAESVHQLVGGAALRAGLAADAIGRGQDLPAEYNVLGTPRSATAVTHHLGMLLPDTPIGGWADDRPLARLEPGVEAWLRQRLGPATAWGLAPAPDGAGWCALDLLVATAEAVRAAVAPDGANGEETLARLGLLLERLRAALAVSMPLTPAHLDRADALGGARYDVADLAERVNRWLREVRAAAAALDAAQEPDAVASAVRTLGGLGLPIGTGGAGGDGDRLRTLLAGAELDDPPTPPDPARLPAEAAAWAAEVLAVTAAVLHPSLRVVPRLTGPLPPSPHPAVDADTVSSWLRDVALVRSGADAFDGALIAAEVLAGTPAANLVVAQPALAPAGPAPWLATAAVDDSPGPRSSLVLQRDGPGGGALRGLVVDSWTEVVPRASGPHGPEEIVGVAFDFDRPGARSPQSMLLAVPPDPARGWCMEDLHGCVEETLLLARIRTMDLTDVPELRQVLPVPNGMG